MKIYVTTTQLFDQNLFQDLLILLNKFKGFVEFKPLLSFVNLKQEEIQTRCIPHDKLWKKFILQPSLLTEVIKIHEDLAPSNSLLQKNTFDSNTIYARSIREANALPPNDYKKYALLQLIYGMLRISFVHQSYPMTAQTFEDGSRAFACEPCMEHDVFVDTKLLFQKCQEQREQQRLANTDFLLLFTSVNIDANWIYAQDPTYANNIIINAHPLSMIFNDQQLSAALTYYVAIGVITKLMHWSFIDWYLHQHPQSKGCIMDFNHPHEEALDQILASKICPTCTKLIASNDLPTELLTQLSKILEESRKELKIKN